MTREQYGKIEALNFSTIKHLLDGPAYFQYARSHPTEETSFMRTGTGVHGRVLEGINPDELYAIKPEGMSFATKEGKAWRDAQTKPIISQDDHDNIFGMEKAILAHPLAKELLDMCSDRETMATGIIGGRQFKALLDASCPNAIMDIKKVQDASERSFSATVQDRHYDLQLYIYRLLHGADYCAWIAVEEKAPHGVQVFTMSNELIDSGAEKLERCLSILAECEATGLWPAYPIPSEPLPLTLPAWRRSELVMWGLRP